MIKLSPFFFFLNDRLSRGQSVMAGWQSITHEVRAQLVLVFFSSKKKKKKKTALKT